MKKTITLISSILVFSAPFKAQVVADFENFTLASESHYIDSTGADFVAGNSVFRYDFNFGYWLGGFAYSNITDSVTSGFMNQYSAKAASGYNNSTTYVVGQNGGIINLVPTGVPNTTVGFYVTNSTYAYNSMRDGDMFAKKFGGTSGNDPDWFKLVVKRYANGIIMPDSVEFYLADYRFADNAQDYIVKTWQYIDLSSFGASDSLLFELSSSDVGSFGMNTPGYFCMDNFTTLPTIGLNSYTKQEIHAYPNPVSDVLTIQVNQAQAYEIISTNGEIVKKGELNGTGKWNKISVNELNKGIYILKLQNGASIATKKIIVE